MADKTNYIMMLAGSLMVKLGIERNTVSILVHNKQKVNDEVKTFSSQTKGKIISHAIGLECEDFTTAPPRRISPFSLPHNGLDCLWGKSGPEILDKLATHTILAAMVDLVSVNQE